MARTKSIKSIEGKIAETESKVLKTKECCNKLAQELDGLYEEKKQIENQGLLDAIREA